MSKYKELLEYIEDNNANPKFDGEAGSLKAKKLVENALELADMLERGEISESMIKNISDVTKCRYIPIYLLEAYAKELLRSVEDV